VFRHASLGFAAQFGAALILFLNSVALARIWGPREFCV
jgi:hypothetical protein